MGSGTGRSKKEAEQSAARSVGSGTGRSKKEAEQSAARSAPEQLKKREK